MHVKPSAATEKFQPLGVSVGRGGCPAGSPALPSGPGKGVGCTGPNPNAGAWRSCETPGVTPHLWLSHGRCGAQWFGEGGGHRDPGRDTGFCWGGRTLMEARSLPTPPASQRPPSASAPLTRTVCPVHFGTRAHTSTPSPPLCLVQGSRIPACSFQPLFISPEVEVQALSGGPLH